MRAAAIGLLTGTALLHQRPLLPSWFTIVMLLAVALALGAWAARIRPGGRRRMLAMLGCGAACGFAWAAMYAHYQLREELPREWEGRDVTLIGTVASLPQPLPHGARFHFQVERQVSAPESVVDVPDRIALSWHPHAERGEKMPRLEPGERWQLTVRLRRPHGNANPHGFDHEAWMLERGLRASGHVRPDDRSELKNLRLDRFVYSPGNVIERTRSWLRDRIQRVLRDRPYAGVIVALVIGDQRAISQSDWEVFNRSGIGHLISISGLHITMIAGMCAASFGYFWRRSFFTGAALPLRLPVQKAMALAGAAAAFGYVLLAGFGVPAQRTLYMLCVVAGALWSGRLASISAVLCAALAIVVLVDPWAVLWPGFWLSFAAVAIILYVTVGRSAVRDRTGPTSLGARLWPIVLAGCRTQYAITIGLVPLSMLLFGQISLISPIANALAIPLVSLLVTPLALAGSMLPPPFCQPLLLLSHAGIELLAAVLGELSTLSAAVWGVPIPSAAAFLAALVGTLWLLAPSGWPMRWLGLVWLLPLALAAPARPAPGELWVTAFDVGQGSAVLIETHGHRMLYDTGPAYSEDGDAGDRVLLPYLKARGIDAIDALMVSHSDIDHAGGALSLLAGLDIGWVSSSLPPEHAIAKRAARHRRCEQGERWDWDGVRFELLYPTPDAYERSDGRGSKKSKPNHRSCTLKITAGRHAILLPGDIEAGQEAELVAQLGNGLRADVLFAPHHGSGTSSTRAFLEAVRPQVAVFQLGYRNRYRHPRDDIYQRYAELGVRRLRTDASGAIRIRIADSMEISEHRVEQARYWHKREPASDREAVPASTGGDAGAD